jgi:hypothetical protein
MGVLDAALHIGRETTYGTPAPLTQSIESTADGHKRAPKVLESTGMRAGAQAAASDRARMVNMGAEGSIPVEFQNKGMGKLLRLMTGSSAIAQEGATAAWLQTHSTTKDGPVGESVTVQVIKPSTGSTFPFTYHGGVCTGWELTQEVDDLLKLSLDMDYEDETTDVAAGTPTYAAGSSPFAWEDCVVTVDGAPTDLRKLSLKGNMNVDTDRRYLRGTALKKAPLRKGLPVYDGELTSDFDDLTAYDRFVAGVPVPLVATWTGSLIAAGFPFMLRASATVQFRGDTPQASLTDLASQPMPFKVLWDRTNPAVKLEYRSTDLAF